MIHARKDYDRIQDSENKIPKDEPVFLIRAQDEIGWKVVLYYAFLRVQQYHEETDEINVHLDELTDMVVEQARKMRKWPKKKKADL